ncbi:MAG: hypothetical protein R6V03_05370 [Kiritimatiellia bacterium]
MRRSEKPVRKCYSCPLNLGDHCWLYAYPRGQWRNRRKCSAFDDPEVHKAFRAWLKQPVVKNRKELRREIFRTRRKKRTPGARGIKR